VEVVLTACFLAACVFLVDSKQEAKTAGQIGLLTAAEIACAIANASLDNDAVAEACRVQKELRPVLDELLKSHRKVQAQRCGGDSAPDAGRP
jgi:hypothetical protein